MLYRPNFCCNCGEKIERTDWNLLTSRRFCEACSIENKRYDRIPQLTVAGGVLAVMFGLGALFGGERERPAPVQTVNASPAQLRPETQALAPVGRVEAPAMLSAEPQAGSSTTGETGTPGTTSGVPAKTYYCGALTKKGTPCSRKVKAAATRCFQHQGKALAEPGA